MIVVQSPAKKEFIRSKDLGRVILSPENEVVIPGQQTLLGHTKILKTVTSKIQEKKAVCT